MIGRELIYVEVQPHDPMNLISRKEAKSNLSKVLLNTTGVKQENWMFDKFYYIQRERRIRETLKNGYTLPIYQNIISLGTHDENNIYQLQYQQKQRDVISEEEAEEGNESLEMVRKQIANRQRNNSSKTRIPYSNKQQFYVHGQQRIQGSDPQSSKSNEIASQASIKKTGLSNNQINHGVISDKSPSSGIRDSAMFESNNKGSKNASEYTFQGNNNNYQQDNGSNYQFKYYEDEMSSLARFQSPGNYMTNNMNNPLFYQNQQKPRSPSLGSLGSSNQLKKNYLMQGINRIPEEEDSPNKSRTKSHFHQNQDNKLNESSEDNSLIQKESSLPKQESQKQGKFGSYKFKERSNSEFQVRQQQMQNQNSNSIFPPIVQQNIQIQNQVALRIQSDQKKSTINNNYNNGNNTASNGKLRLITDYSQMNQMDPSHIIKEEIIEAEDEGNSPQNQVITPNIVQKSNESQNQKLEQSINNILPQEDNQQRERIDIFNFHKEQQSEIQSPLTSKNNMGSNNNQPNNEIANSSYNMPNEVQQSQQSVIDPYDLQQVNVSDLAFKKKLVKKANHSNSEKNIFKQNNYVDGQIQEQNQQDLIRNDQQNEEIDGFNYTKYKKAT